MIFRGGHRAPRLIVDQPGGEANLEGISTSHR